MTFSLIPSLDLLDGRVVRLVEGDFGRVTEYGDADRIAAGWPRGTLVHVVDLDGSRRGRPVELDAVRRFAGGGLRVQAGGGVRTLADALAWLDAGAERVVVGTVACEDPSLFERIVAAAGPARVLPAVDVRDGRVRVSGWERDGSRSVGETLAMLERAGCEEVLVTDVSRDGRLAGPSFALYRDLATRTSMRVVASGGVASRRDVQSLARLPNVAGVVVGKAILEGRLGVDACAAEPPLAPRVIPCLDVRDGRVAKGVRFESLRDAGDPARLARRYEREGADEIVVLDISATPSGRATALETVRRIADAIFIPLTAGGGVRSVDDFRALLRAGADRVAINSAAVLRPALLAEAAAEFGAQAVVLACDARREGERDAVVISGGRVPTDLDAVAWCRRAEALGAGEVLLTSIDRDGTHAGFDAALVRRVASALRIGVIASGGAGAVDHFREAVEEGGASAVLAASLFHDRALSIGDVKRHLARSGIAVRGGWS